MGKKHSQEHDIPVVDQHTRFLHEQYDREQHDRTARLAAELAYRQRLLFELAS